MSSSPGSGLELGLYDTLPLYQGQAYLSYNIVCVIDLFSSCMMMHCGQQLYHHNYPLLKMQLICELI